MIRPIPYNYGNLNSFINTTKLQLMMLRVLLHNTCQKQTQHLPNFGGKHSIVDRLFKVKPNSSFSFSVFGETCGITFKPTLRQKAWKSEHNFAHFADVQRAHQLLIWR